MEQKKVESDDIKLPKLVTEPNDLNKKVKSGYDKSELAILDFIMWSYKGNTDFAEKIYKKYMESKTDKPTEESSHLMDASRYLAKGITKENIIPKFEPEKTDVPKEELSELQSMIINRFPPEIYGEDSVVEEFYNRCTDLEKELADLRAEAERYRLMNNVLLDGEHESSMANEINKLQIQNQELRAELKKVYDEKDRIQNEGNFWYAKAEELKADNERLNNKLTYWESWFKEELQRRWPSEGDICSFIESDGPYVRRFSKWLKSYLENK